MPADSHQFSDDAFGRQDEIHAAGVDRGLRHGRELCRGLILRKCHAPRRPDGLNTRRAVRSRAGEDYANGLAPTVLGERPEEPVDGHVRTRRFCAQSQFQHAALDGQIGIRRHDVDVVGLHGHAVSRLG